MALMIIDQAYKDELKLTYKPYTLVEPTVTGPLIDPLVGLSFDNRLYLPMHNGS